MTDEEKARDIAGHLINYHKTHTNPFKSMFISAMEMAKWKDSQYSEEKKELLGLVRMLPVDGYNQTIIEDLISMLE